MLRNGKLRDRKLETSVKLSKTKASISLSLPAIQVICKVNLTQTLTAAAAGKCEGEPTAEKYVSITLILIPIIFNFHFIVCTIEA